jgi:hypothetical protein
MIKDEVQKQEGGDSSTNLQGKNITINQGISYADAKAIALDVYKANFLQLSQEAADLARARAEELTDDFLIKLKEENEAAVTEMNTPGMQAALYEAQKQYAKTGDKNLEALLVDILVERASTPERNIHQIVLDESLTVASKLTTEQMDALTVNFLLSKTKNYTLVNLESVSKYIATDIVPFLTELTDTSSCYEHLEYVGCGSLMGVSRIHPIEHLFRLHYPTLFSKGFDEERFVKDIGSLTEYNGFIMKCFHYPNMYQFKAIDTEVLNKISDDLNIPEEIKNKMVALFNSTLMNDNEIKECLVNTKPELQTLFDLWKNSSISNFSLTTVGIAIAHANYRRRTGVKLDLSIWVK